MRPGNFDGIGYTTTGILSRRALVDCYSKYDDRTTYLVSFGQCNGSSMVIAMSVSQALLHQF